MKLILSLLPAFEWLSIGDQYLGSNSCSIILDSLFDSGVIDFDNIIGEILLTPYNIVRLIMAIGGCFGIWFGRKGGHALFVVVSLLVAVGNLASLGVEVF